MKIRLRLSFLVLLISFTIIIDSSIAIANFNDPLFEKQWSLHNEGQKINFSSGKKGIDIGLLQAQKLLNPQREIIVAVLDDGLDINHPDLKGNIWTNKNEIPNNGIDDDNNGYIDDIHGWDFFNEDATLMDHEILSFHGTHVAGIIAAVKDNSVGIQGIAPNVKIMGLKVMEDMNDDGSYEEYIERVIAALKYAKENGALIANNSWGWARESKNLSSYDKKLAKAIEDSELLFVAAAGNTGVNNDLGGDTPSDLPAENIISVSAINSEGIIPRWANYGKTSVDIVAPGVQILSTFPKKPFLNASIYTEKSSYQVITNGFPIPLLATNDQEYVLKKYLDYFNKKGNVETVLLVDDSASSFYDSNDYIELNLQQAYKNTLIKLGIKEENIKILNVNRNEFGPTAKEMAKYDLVIWETGFDDGFNFNTQTYEDIQLTKKDIAQIKTFLNSYKGRLLLSGERTLTRIYDNEFFQDLLGLRLLATMEGDIYPWYYTNIVDSQYRSQDSNEAYLYSSVFETLIGEAKVVFQYEGDLDYNNAYQYLDGTSQAAPIVSGIAAVIMSNSTLTPLETKELILQSGTPIDSLKGKVASGKMANLNRAMLALESAHKNLWYEIEEKVDIPPDKKQWEIKFNTTLDKNTVIPMNVYITDKMNRKLKTNAYLSKQENSIIVDFEYPLVSKETYYLYVGKGVKSKEEIPLKTGIRMKFSVK